MVRHSANIMRTVGHVVALTGGIAIYACGSGSKPVPQGSSVQPETQAQASLDLPAVVGPPEVVLRRAALEGDVALVRSAIAKGADVNASNSAGVTPLMLAASKGNREVVEELISKHARIDAVTRDDRVTALMMAANWAHTPVVDLLIDKGANINLTDGGERTVLDWAGMGSRVPAHEAKALQRHLKEKGVRVKQQDALGLFLSVGSMPKLDELIAPPRPGEVIAASTLPVNETLAAVRVGGNVPQPVKIRNVPPVYPPAAKAARVQGVVIVETTIDRDGKVVDTRVLRSIPQLDQAAIDAVRQWEFKPTVLNGVATPVVVTLAVNFTLD